MTKKQLFTEGFEPIKNHEDYLIHRDGRIWSLMLKRFIKQSASRGYLKIRLNGTLYSHHRILAIQFLPNPENKPNINHIDEIKSNNNLINLEWCTQKENVNHSLYKQIGQKRPSISGLKHPQCKLKKHYETFAVTRGNFKRACKIKGWVFDDFIEVCSLYKQGYNKKYYYYII